MDKQQLASRLTTILDMPIAGISALHGGMIGEVYQVSLPDQRNLVVKVATDQLDIEGYMLRYLARHTALPVPDVLHNDPGLLVMSFIDGRSFFSARAERHAAALLVDLHNHTAPAFGLERDTLIGPLPQPNPWTSRWVDFFRDHRLLYMGRVALDAGRLPARTLTRIEKLAARLDTLLEEPEQPSLIHGDIWSTNVLASADQITGFIDPAIYYAHAEMELAYITLFNTFGRAFFEHYHAQRPIEPGFFEVRRDIYNLYPLLVHVRCFGGGYVGSVEAILSRFGV